MKCIKCGGTKFERALHPHSMRVAGLQFHAKLPMRACKKCGEGTVEGHIYEEMEIQVARKLSEGAPSPEAFRFIRKTLGLTGKGFAQKIGAAGETISRYENGSLTIPLPTWLLLGTLIKLADAGEKHLNLVREQLESAKTEGASREHDVEIELPTHSRMIA